MYNNNNKAQEASYTSSPEYSHSSVKRFSRMLYRRGKKRFLHISQPPLPHFIFMVPWYLLVVCDTHDTENPVVWVQDYVCDCWLLCFNVGYISYKEYYSACFYSPGIG